MVWIFARAWSGHLVRSFVKSLSRSYHVRIQIERYHKVTGLEIKKNKSRKIRTSTKSESNRVVHLFAFRRSTLTFWQVNLKPPGPPIFGRLTVKFESSWLRMMEFSGSRKKMSLDLSVIESIIWTVIFLVFFVYF